MSVEKLFEELNPTGFCQIWTLIVIVGARSLISMITFMPVLTTGHQDYVCADHFPNGTFDFTRNATCSGITTGNASCSEWVFDQGRFSSTIRSQFSLVCDQEYMAELSMTLYFVGCLLGDLFFGFLSDRFGRRKALIVSSCIIFIFSLSSAFAPTFWMYCLARLVAGIGDGGVLNVGFTLLSECTTSKNTVYFTFTFYQGWSIGILFIALVGYFIRNHFFLGIVLSVPQLLIPIMTLSLHESLRWLISKGRLEEADRVAKSIAKRNGIVLPGDFSVKKFVSETVLMAWKDTNTKVASIRTKDVFKYPRVLRVVLIVWLGWFASAFSCYATSLGVSMLGWQLHPVLALSAAVEIPARLYGIVAARRFGRIKSICSAFLFSGILSLLSIAFLYNAELKVFLIVSALISKFFMSQGSDTIVTFTAELFPTCMRNIGISTGCACTRIAAMLAPLIVTLQRFWLPLPFFVLGVLPIISTFALSLLPDTRGHAMIERIEQFNDFLEKKQKHRSWICNKKDKDSRRSSSEWSMDNDEEIRFDNSNEEDDSGISSIEKKSIDDGSEAGDMTEP